CKQSGGFLPAGDKTYSRSPSLSHVTEAVISTRGGKQRQPSDPASKLAAAMAVAAAVVVRWTAGTEGQYRLRTSRR
ncbi:hypothetical protein O3P69_013564, partial [Scylla paramamosain]